MTKSLPNLEKSFAELSTLIDQMEHQELTLDQSLTHFERGINLVKHCQKILSNAEQKVEVLMQQNQKETLIPYEVSDNNKEGSSCDDETC